MSVSPGSFLMCFLATLLLTSYVYVILCVKKDILYEEMKFIFLVLALILIRMLLPVNFPFTVTIISYRIMPAVIGVLYRYIGNTGIDVKGVLIAIWLIGSTLKFGSLIYRQKRYYDLLRPFEVIDMAQYPLLTEALEECGASFFRVCIIPDNIEPAIVGLLHPILILPEYEFTKKELSYICRHEAEHYRHHDLWLKLILELVGCVQWFNPLMYIMQEELVLAFEVANDRMILEESDELERVEYAEFLTRLARRPRRQLKNDYGLSFVRGEKKQIKTRVEFLLSNHYREPGRKGTTVMQYVMIVGLLMCSLFLVPEANMPCAEEDMCLEIPEDTSYFLETEEGYQLFIDGKFIVLTDTIPEELKELRIVGGEKESEG